MRYTQVNFIDFAKLGNQRLMETSTLYCYVLGRESWYADSAGNAIR